MGKRQTNGRNRNHNRRGHTLEGIVKHTLQHGPRAIVDLGIRLYVDDAESIALELQREHGIAIEAYDFPGTIDVWQSARWDGTPYQYLATKQLIATLAAKHGVDYMTLAGFRRILPELTVHSFRHVPISRWETTLGGLLTLSNSEPSTLVLEVIAHDDDFHRIRREGFHDYDFPVAPRNAWLGKEDRKPTDQARRATVQWISRLAAQHRVDYRTVAGFRQILPYMAHERFTTMPINYWRTTLDGMVLVYGNSHIDAVLDAVEHRRELECIRQAGLKAYDFPRTPAVWLDGEGKPAGIAREATRLVLEAQAAQRGIDCRTEHGLRTILSGLTIDAYASTEGNIWGTTFYGAILRAYGSSVAAAVENLIHHDPDFSALRDMNVRSLTPRPRLKYREATQAVPSQTNV